MRGSLLFANRICANISSVSLEVPLSSLLLSVSDSFGCCHHCSCFCLLCDPIHWSLLEVCHSVTNLVQFSTDTIAKRDVCFGIRLEGLCLSVPNWEFFLFVCKL